MNIQFNQDDPVISWLLNGDPAIRWQVRRDLVQDRPESWEKERARIATDGWGAQLLAEQDEKGTWGGGLYSPKWISTTYTLLLLRRMGLPPDTPQAQKGAQILLDEGCFSDGGINFSPSRTHSETCVTGMVLSILAYFQIRETRVHDLAEHLFGQQMQDNGWNCDSYRGATHSSVHTTISVMEGLREYEKAFSESISLVQQKRAEGVEFLLRHELYKSHHTGEIFDQRLTRFSFPPRWYYDVLRALDFFQECSIDYDSRMNDAIALVKKKQRKDGSWPLQNRHHGRTFFEMEQPGKASRWNTLRALRVLRWAEK